MCVCVYAKRVSVCVCERESDARGVAGIILSKESIALSESKYNTR